MDNIKNNKNMNVAAFYGGSHEYLVMQNLYESNNRIVDSVNTLSSTSE